MLEINASLDIKLKLVIMHAQALSQARDSPSYLCIDSSLIKYLEIFGKKYLRMDENDQHRSSIVTI